MLTAIDQDTGRDGLPVITDTAIEYLNDAAKEIQRRLRDKHNETWDILDINEALAKWLEIAIETLAEDAAHHCLAGFNKAVFERLILARPSAQQLADQRVEQEIQRRAA